MLSCPLPAFTCPILSVAPPPPSLSPPFAVSSACLPSLPSGFRLLGAPPSFSTLAVQVLVTCGNSDGMAMVFEAMLGPGDVLLVEESNFAASMSTLCPVAARGVRIVPVPLEASDGSLSSSAMEEVVQKLKAEGAPPKMLYTVPTGQNPTGGTMTLAQLQVGWERVSFLPGFVHTCHVLCL